MSDDPLFIPDASRGDRVRCTVCGRSGYPHGSWKDACRAGHPYECSCGRRFAKLAGVQRHRAHMAKAKQKAEESGMDWPPVSAHEISRQPGAE